MKISYIHVAMLCTLILVVVDIARVVSDVLKALQKYCLNSGMHIMLQMLSILDTANNAWLSGRLSGRFSEWFQYCLHCAA